jgi:tRNA pseudouridine55 synthase
VKIDGERAYRLARRGVVVEMPLRRSSVYTLEPVSWTGPPDAVTSVGLELHVGSGTYVRSIAHALGGHCTTLRRTAVGPFEVDEAVPVESVELIPPSVALARLSRESVERVGAAVRAGVLALEPPADGGVA